MIDKQTNYKQTEIGEIPQSWDIKPLQDLVDFSNGYAFSSKSYVGPDDSAIPVFKMGNIAIGGGLKTTGKEDFVKADVIEKLRNFLTKENDILMCMTDMKSSMNLLGHSARIRNEKFLVNQRVGTIRPKSNVDEAYIYYYLNSPRYIERLRTTARSGVQVNLTTEAIKKSLVVYPPIPEQQQIASILSSLDDKIELNKKMNKTLEETGKALFKHWFVDFEFPSREGKPYKSNGGEMVDGEFGKIPKGWKIAELQAIARVVDCLHNKKPIRKDRGKIMLQVFNIGEKGKLDLSEKYYVSDYDYKEWIKRIEVVGGDLIISKTGRVGVIAQIPYEFKASIGRNLVAIRPAKITPEYLKELMLSQFMTNEIAIRTHSGTILSSLHVKEVEKLPLVLPSTQLVKYFSEVVNNTHFQILNNIKQNDFLSQIRDSLLSRLMSGKLRVNV